MLIAEIEDRDRFQRFGLTCPDPQGIFIEEKDMAVELPCAAACAVLTTKSDLGDNGCKFARRICMQCCKLHSP
jgi:hypothetical protein